MLPIYVTLFNLIFDTSHIPETWTLCQIRPIYKKKGDPKQSENYRPITLLSSFGKLFTSIINKRLTSLSESCNIISGAQSGLRKKYSTTDNLFVLKSLIDIVQSSKRKLYCCFIDLNKHLTQIGGQVYGPNSLNQEYMESVLISSIVYTRTYSPKW